MKRPRINLDLIRQVKTLAIFNVYHFGIIRRFKTIYGDIYPFPDKKMIKPNNYERHLMKCFRNSHNGEDKIAPCLEYIEGFRQYVMSNLDSNFNRDREADMINALYSLILSIEVLFNKNGHMTFYKINSDQFFQLHRQCVLFYKTLYEHFNSSGRKFPPEYKFSSKYFVPGNPIELPRPVTPFDPNSAEFTPPTSPAAPTSPRAF